jgi:hypothetical protein
MISKMFRFALVIVLVTFTLGSAAWACSSTSVSGVYGFVGNGINANNLPTATLLQLDFDSSTSTFAGSGVSSTAGVISTGLISGKYSLLPNCTITGTVTFGTKTQTFSAVVTSTGGVKEVDTKTGHIDGGVLLPQGSATCTNAGVAGSFGLNADGVNVTGAPFTGPLALIGELGLSVNAAGDGVIVGHIAGSEDGTILQFATEPVTGSYAIKADCTGTATITPKGKTAMDFSLVVVNGGKGMFLLQTNADTVVTGDLQR